MLLPALLIRVTQAPQAYVPILSKLFDIRLAEAYRWSLLMAITYCAYYSTLTLISILPIIMEGVCWVLKKDILAVLRRTGDQSIIEPGTRTAAEERAERHADREDPARGARSSGAASTTPGRGGRARRRASMAGAKSTAHSSASGKRCRRPGRA